MEGDSEADSCPICFDTFRFPKILPCGHTFCFPCLKEYSDEKSSSNVIICPLCRTKNTIPKMGLNGFITNYFVQNSKPEKVCLNCKITEISTCCTICFSYLCAKCFKAHVHPSANNSSLSDNEDEDDIRINLPFNPNLFLQNVRTKYICKVESQFVVETEQDECGGHLIYSLYPSKSGGIFITPNGVPYILQLDRQGNIKERIRTPFQCVDILEFEDGSLLGTFGVNGLILKYMCGGWTNFTSCPDYFPLSITTLSNGNIAACGVNKTQLTRGSYARGRIQVYSQEGEPLKRLDKCLEKDNILAILIKMTACKEQKTIAVIDQENSLVIVLHEDGNVIQVYRGANTMLPLPIPELGLRNSGRFRPLGICCSLNGFLFVSSSDGSLHILDHSGNFCGLALTDCEDGFGDLADLRQDQNGIIWCSDSQNGMIRTFKIIRFQNDFSDSHGSLRFELG